MAAPVAPKGMTVKGCTCESKFCDTRYGDKRRPHNKTTKGVRCCVCGKNS